MEITRPLNLKRWVESNRHLLKPPVGNKVVYEDGDFIIMVVGGPNKRKDYHVDPLEEFFYQLEGDMMLKIIDNGKKVDMIIKVIDDMVYDSDIGKWITIEEYNNYMNEILSITFS